MESATASRWAIPWPTDSSATARLNPDIQPPNQQLYAKGDSLFLSTDDRSALPMASGSGTPSRSVPACSKSTSMGRVDG